MGKIFYMMGKSSSGKDTLFQEVRKVFPEMKTITLYTTRPMREGERDGSEYFFVTPEILKAYEEEGKIIECRDYHTVHGLWKYATVDDGQVILDKNDYLAIGTLASFEKLCEYYGRERLVPIYIEVEDGERLSRALLRERRQDAPKYLELCRRFLADAEDFSEDKLKQCKITKKFVNEDRRQCLEKIIEEVQNGKF